MKKIQTDFNHVTTIIQQSGHNDKWWYQVLIHSTYNKRLYNNKRKRIQRFNTAYNVVHQEKKDYLQRYRNMNTLHSKLAEWMNSDPKSKTICFAIKIFGYGARRVYQKMYTYPDNIAIPIDSRLITIAKNHLPTQKHTQKNYHDFYDTLAKKSGIPPLHLDSLIRLEYRKRFYQ